MPGLPGKNIVDLGIEAVPDDIPAVSESLLSLGFGRQGGIAPFPPTRPMLTGSVVHDGRPYRIHLHVMPPARGELAELLAFRDALRADPALCDAYAAAKRRIVDAAPDGDANQLYTVRKGDFVLDSLYRLGIRRPPADRPEPLRPGATIGILGGGQLGRMLGLAARAMGYRIVVLDPDPACPAAAVADEIIVGRYDDVDAARRLAAMSDVVTYELEHVGLEVAAAAGEGAPLRPGLAALRATQDRLAERRFIRDVGEWTAPWREVRGIEEAEAAADALGYPCRLKVPIGGYDGRSQVRIAARADVAVGRRVPGRRGWPPAARSRRRSTSRRSCRASSPATATAGRSRSRSRATSTTTGSSSRAWRRPRSTRSRPTTRPRSRSASPASLDLVGLLTVELFLLRGGGLMVNELAPRVHNSGHWTIEGAVTSQFEQHVRAICGLPLGSVRPHGVTGDGQPARHRARPGRAPRPGVEDALADPDAHVHVYGKRRVFERRKMGHVTVIGTDADEALGRARTARAALRWED